MTILRGCINRKNKKIKTEEFFLLNIDDLRQSTEAEKKTTSSPFINLTFAEPSIITIVNTLINANEVFSFSLFTIKVYEWI